MMENSTSREKTFLLLTLKVKERPDGSHYSSTLITSVKNKLTKILLSTLLIYTKISGMLIKFKRYKLRMTFMLLNSETLKPEFQLINKKRELSSTVPHLK